MPMTYVYIAIPDSRIPKASSLLFQHLLDTYASETNKVISVWRCFSTEDMAFRPHPRSKTVVEIMKHQLLSERRFFGEFMGVPEPPAAQVLPAHETPQAYVARMQDLAEPRLGFFANQAEEWWLEQVPFFDVIRERIWIFWRRLLHTCHHRTQLTVYLRMMNKSVPSTYGPTADVTWEGADPTQTVEAASRK
jgi:uncharacterized damage-inducible protein DinB